MVCEKDERIAQSNSGINLASLSAQIAANNELIDELKSVPNFDLLVDLVSICRALEEDQQHLVKVHRELELLEVNDDLKEIESCSADCDAIKKEKAENGCEGGSEGVGEKKGHLEKANSIFPTGYSRQSGKINLSLKNLVIFRIYNLNGSIEYHLGTVQKISKGPPVLENQIEADQMDKSCSHDSEQVHCLTSRMDMHVLVSFAAPLVESQITCPNLFTENTVFSSPMDVINTTRFSHDCNNAACTYHHGLWVNERDVQKVDWNAEDLMVGDEVLVNVSSNQCLWKVGKITSLRKKNSLPPISLGDLHEEGDNNEVLLEVAMTDGQMLHNRLTVGLENILPSPQTAQYFGRDEGPLLKRDDILESDGEEGENSTFDQWKLRLNETNSSNWFGLWERHTKAFGSKMLLKMGYKFGDSLGKQQYSDNKSLIDPLPIRLLPPRRGLDFINGAKGGLNDRKTKQSDSVSRREGVIVVDFKSEKDYNLANYFDKGKKTITPEMVGGFGILNSKMLLVGVTELDKRNEEDMKNKEAGHRVKLEELRKGRTSEEDLRKSLFKIDQELCQKKQELKVTTQNLVRHSGKGKVAQLEKSYSELVAAKELEIKKLAECREAISKRFNTNRAKKKLKTF